MVGTNLNSTPRRSYCKLCLTEKYWIINFLGDRICWDKNLGLLGSKWNAYFVLAISTSAISPLFFGIRKYICMMIAEMPETHGSITCWEFTNYSNTSRCVSMFSPLSQQVWGKDHVANFKSTQETALKHKNLHFSRWENSSYF